MKKKMISLIFSFRNEQSNLEELIKRAEKTLESIRYDYEIIFIDDDSIDGSYKILEENRERNNKIKIIKMSRRFGISPCVLAGFSHSSGDAIIYMDSDLQDPPELITELISKWEDGNDVVHTIRTKRKGENAFRMFLTNIAYKIIDSISDIKIRHNSGDFKLISRRAVDTILELNDHDPFLRGLSAWVGFKQTNIFYEREPRFKGSSKFSLLNSSGMYKDFIRGITTFSSVPLYLSLYVGLIVSLSSFAFILYIILKKFLFGIDNSGWASLMVVSLFLGGSILFSIGIQGIYIGKIYESVKSRPRYIVEFKKGFDNIK